MAKPIIRTSSGEDTIRYLEKILKGKKVITAEIDDTIIIKQIFEPFKTWASPIWKKAKEEGITEKDIQEIIKEARQRA